MWKYCPSSSKIFGNQTGFRLSSEKRHNLSFNIAVNNLPRQLRIVIGRKFFWSKWIAFIFVYWFYITYKPNVGHYTRVKNCIKYLLISREKHIWWRFYIFVYNIIFPTSFIISSCVILRLVSSFRGPILTLSRRSVSKFSCCTRGSPGALFRFFKNLNKSSKGMLGCFLSLPLFKSFQYSFGSDVFNFLYLLHDKFYYVC